ncbi:MAG: indole-3-glycerol phosphate synthase TrpC [Pseudomonadota bacterium]
MNRILHDIVAEKQKEVRRLKTNGLAAFPKRSFSAGRDFKKAIGEGGGINLIAEIKFASPSEGRICSPLDPLVVGRTYERAGAAALSLITDRTFFQGDLDTLPLVKRAVSLPVLRKDFILDEIQVQETFAYGADALLLIARILSRSQLGTLLTLTRELGMSALTEIHDPEDLEKAVDCGAEIIGINNRNLDTFEVDLQTTFQLAPLVPKACVLVSESGISGPEDIQTLRETEIRAVLVGTAIMKSDDPEKKVSELVRAGRGQNG